MLDEQSVLAETLETSLQRSERRWIRDLADDVLGPRAAEAFDNIEQLAVELVWGADHQPRESVFTILKALEALLVLNEGTSQIKGEVLEVVGQLTSVVSSSGDNAAQSEG